MMQKSTTMKGASALAALAGVLFIGSSVASYVENTALAWFPILMAVAWFIIAALFYQRAQRMEQKPAERTATIHQQTHEHQRK
jgi:4-hydroxybenzoate polyprenyltransferase